MRLLIRLVSALAVVFVSGTALAEKQSVVIQCAQSCAAVAAQVAQLGGEVTIAYRNVSAIAVSLPVERLAALSGMSGVKAFSKDIMVELPRPVEAGLGSKGAGPFALETPLEVRAMSAAEVAAASSGSNPADYAFNNSLIGATAQHAAGHQGAGVIVAVIDTGTTNAPVVPSLSGTVIGGENFVPGDPVASATSRRNDPHGTWVGTVIAGHAAFAFNNTSTLVRSIRANAGPDNFVGACPVAPPTVACFVPITGVAPAAKIYAMKVFPSTGGGAPESRIIEAMDRAITLRQNYNNGMPSVPIAGDGTENNPFRYDSLNIQVVNMSLGGPTLSAGRDLEDALTLVMLQTGITIVASAGNDGFAAMTGGSPGTGMGSLTVGAASTFRHERILRDVQFGFGIGPLYRPTTGIQTADFSSRGPTADGRLDPDITANGFATLAQGTCQGSAGCLAGTAFAPINLVSGTSFSAPTAAGAAALLRGKHPSANAILVRNALQQSANPNMLTDGSGVIDQGAGFLDVTAASAVLASGNVAQNIVVPPYPNGLDAVRYNLGRIGFNTVNFTNGKYSTRVSNLKPGQVAQFFLRSQYDTLKFIVRLKNITPANPPAAQNALFGDDIFLQVADAATSSGEIRANAFVAADSEFVIDRTMSGLVRVALQGDWTNAGMISADLEIEQVRNPIANVTQGGALVQGGVTEVAVDVPAGAAQAMFQLFWGYDWGSYPTNDADMIVKAPDGKVLTGGATLATPERVIVENPAPGRWTVQVNGFQINQADQFAVVVTADGQLLQPAN